MRGAETFGRFSAADKHGTRANTGRFVLDVTFGGPRAV